MRKRLSVPAALVIFFLAWEAASLLAGRPFLPGPPEALNALARLAREGKLFPHLWASLFRVLMALLTGALPAAVLGIASGRSKRLNSVVTPVIYLLHPLPKAAFLPVIMLFLGIGEVSRVFLVGFIISSQVLVTTRDAAKRVPPGALDSVRSMGAGKGAVFAHVILPSVLPDFFTALRVSLGTAVAVLFLAETFASQSGLGYLIMDAWTRVAYAEMYAAILTLSFLGLLLFAALDAAGYLLCPWQREP